MKKILIIALVVSMWLLSACSAPKVDYVSVFIDDGPDVPRHMFTENTLVFTPDYSKRDLHVKYDQVFPYRTDETVGEDVSTEGLLGGEFFDGFDDIVDRFQDPYEAYSEDEVQGGSVFKLSIKDLSGEVRDYDMRLAKDENDFNLINEFYGDVSALFTQDVY